MHRLKNRADKLTNIHAHLGHMLYYRNGTWQDCCCLKFQVGDVLPSAEKEVKHTRSIVSHTRGQTLIRYQPMWDHWWIKWQWDRFYFGFPTSLPFQQCSILISYLSTNNAIHILSKFQVSLNTIPISQSSDHSVPEEKTLEPTEYENEWAAGIELPLYSQHRNTWGG